MLDRAKQLIRNRLDDPRSILAGSIGGLTATSILSGRAGYKARKKIIDEDLESASLVDKAKVIGPYFIGTVAAYSATVLVLVGGHRSNNNRTAMALAAYNAAEAAHTKYKEAVVENYGADGAQRVRETVAKNDIEKNEPAAIAKALLVGSGDVMCQEAYTGRLFMSDAEALKSARNEINSTLMNGVGTTVSLSEFYDILGLDHTSNSDDFGWDSNRMLDLTFASVLVHGRPYLSFEYSYIQPLKGTR